jgi:hypothetical protein
MPLVTGTVTVMDRLDERTWGRRERSKTASKEKEGVSRRGSSFFNEQGSSSRGRQFFKGWLALVFCRLSCPCITVLFVTIYRIEGWQGSIASPPSPPLNSLI